MTLIKKLMERNDVRSFLLVMVHVFVFNDSQAQIEGPAQVCPRVPLTYNAPSDFGRPRWTIAGGTIISGSTSLSVIVQWNETGSRYLQLKSLNSIDDIYTLYVTIYSGPTTTGGSTCIGGSAQLSASGGTSYQWYTSAGVAIPGANGNVYNTPALSVNTNYFVSRIIGAGCESTVTSVAATITPGPAAPNAFGFSTNAQCGVTTLTAPATPEGVMYYWQSDANGTSTSNSSATYT